MFNRVCDSYNILSPLFVLHFFQIFIFIGFLFHFILILFAFSFDVDSVSNSTFDTDDVFPSTDARSEEFATIRRSFPVCLLCIAVLLALLFLACVVIADIFSFLLSASYMISIIL